MKFSIILFIVWIALISSFEVFSQNCNNDLPDKIVWTGTSFGSTKWKPGNTLGLKIEKIRSGEFIVSDITAGFFNANKISYEVEVQISVRCDGSISPLDFASDFGEGSILSGQWDATTRKLTIQWEIPKNNLRETSTFLIQ